MLYPIETAPKDESIFLAYAENEGNKGFTCVYFNQHQQEFLEPVTGTVVHYLTKWTNLPWQDV